MTIDPRLIDALPVAAYTTDAEGRITSYNEAAVALWGRHPEPGERWCGGKRVLRLDGSEVAPGLTPIAIALRVQWTRSPLR